MMTTVFNSNHHHVSSGCNDNENVSNELPLGLGCRLISLKIDLGNETHNSDIDYDTYHKYLSHEILIVQV